METSFSTLTGHQTNEVYSPGSLGNGDQHEPLLGCFKFLFLNFQFIVYQELITTSMLHK